MAVDAERLRVLVEVAHAGSITAAARRMSLTPSALSQQLAKLERELGVELLRRGARGVALTEAGRVLVGHGEVVLGELRAAERSVRCLLGQSPAQLAIGAFTTAGAWLVPDVLATFRRDHPEVRLSLQDLEPPAGYGLVTSGDLDLLITHRYPGVTLPPATGLRRRKLLVDPLLLVWPDRGGPARPTVPLAELATEDWICGGPGVADRITLTALTEAAGFTPHIAYETQDYQVSLALVAAGLGCALVPASVLRRHGAPGCRTSELAGAAPAREVYVVHRVRPLPFVAEIVHLLRGKVTGSVG